MYMKCRKIHKIISAITMKICLLLILFVTESVISEINLYSKCHLQYHEKDDVCSLESPSFSEPGPRTLPECAILCSFSEVTLSK